MEDSAIVDQICEMYRSGLSKEKIGKSIGFSERRVARILESQSVTRESVGGRLLKQKDEIVGKYNSGIGSPTLAKEYGCSLKSMVTFLHKHTKVARKTPVVDRLRQNKNTIIDLYNSGCSTYKLAKDYDTQDAMIYLFLRDECGVEMRVNNEKVFEDHSEHVAKLYDDGLSISAISKVIGANKKTIASWLKRLNRDPSRYSNLKEIPVKTYSEEIVKKYLSGTGCTKLSREYSCGEGTVLDIIRANGYETGINHRKYDIDHDYFESIDSWWKAYWLGWIITDGSNSETSLRIQITDKEIVEKFNETFNGQAPYKFVKRRQEHHKDQYKVCLNSVKLCQDLTNLGIIKNKTHETYFPDIDEKYWAPFLLGATEGDGSIILRQNKRGDYQGCWSIIGNYRFMLGIAERMSRKLDISFKFYDQKSAKDNIKILRTRFFNETIRLLDYIYQDAPFYLQRKYEKYLQLKGISCSSF